MCAPSLINLPLGTQDNFCRAFWVPGKGLYFSPRRRSNIWNDTRGVPWAYTVVKLTDKLHEILFLSPPFPGTDT